MEHYLIKKTFKETFEVWTDAVWVLYRILHTTTFYIHTHTYTYTMLNKIADRKCGIIVSTATHHYKNIQLLYQYFKKRQDN